MAVRLGDNTWKTGESPVYSQDLNDTFLAVREIKVASLDVYTTTDGYVVLRSKTLTGNERRIFGIVKVGASAPAGANVTVDWIIRANYTDGTSEDFIIHSASKNNTGGVTLYYYKVVEVEITTTKNIQSIEISVNKTGGGSAGYWSRDANETLWLDSYLTGDTRDSRLFFI